MKSAVRRAERLAHKMYEFAAKRADLEYVIKRIMADYRGEESS